jgi:N-acetylmuramoyl-L-alanine amidase
MSRRKETNYIVIHSTNTKPNVNLSARDIDERHRKRGLLKIGYHCIIKRDGTIEVGRPFNEIGAHIQEYDNQSIGVCIVGGKNTRGVVAPDYSAQQQKALYVLIKTLTYMYKDAKVVGHNKLEKTDCPSFNVEEWWASNYQINFKVGGLHG